MLAVAALGLGAGLDTTDLCAVRGTDITTAPDGTVLIDVRSDRPRQTVPLRRYEPLLADLAQAAGPGWIVNPDVDPTGSNPGRILGKQHPPASQNPTSGPPLVLARARATWIYHHLAAGTPLNVLTAATGLAPIALARYAVHLDPVGDDDRRARLRDA